MRKSRNQGPAMQYGRSGVGVTSVWLDILQNLMFGLKKALIQAQKPMACGVKLECAATQLNPSSIIQIVEVSVRYTALLAAALVCLVLASDTGLSQNTANQTLNFSVAAIARITVSGSPAPLSITAGTPGTDALTPVSNALTTYSITHNSNTPLQITAALDANMPSGTKLEISLVSSKGSGGSTVDITSAAATAVPVVTSIARGADAGRSITYTFSADASAGAMSSFARTVTLTLTN